MMANVSQLNDLRSYSRHWLGEFIDLYQLEECLWQPKHPDYSNNTVRNKAYDKLVEKLKEVEPNPDRNMVVRKINSLRSAFRREYRKTNAKQNYETRLWYYDKLSFIADQNLKRSIGSLGGSNSNGSDVKAPKRSLTLAFEDDESLEFEDEQQMEASSAHSTSQTDLQNEAITVANGEMLPVSIVKSEDQKLHHQQQQHHQEPPPLHHHHQHHQHQQQQQHHQQHHHHAAAAAAAAQQIHTQTQPQHTTAVKVLEITSLDSNSQREIQQAVNSLEQQQHQIQLQHQQQQQANGNATAQLTQIHQQVPTIQIAREHLQPLFGTSATYTTAPTTGAQRSEDEFDAIGINVASKLRVMNTHQRIIAEKLISDVLFNGQLDNLSVNSHLTQ